MAFREPPNHLTFEQYAARLRQLREAGQPLSLANIDPDLVRWSQQQCSFYAFAWPILIVGGAILIALVSLVLLT